MPRLKSQSKTEFLRKCVANNKIQADFESDTKIEVCNCLFEHKKKKSSNFVVSSPEEEYIITPEDEEVSDNSPPDKRSAKIPANQPDKWPSQAPQPLDDAKAGKSYPYGSKCPICGEPTISNIRQLEDAPQAHSCVNGHEYSRKDSVKVMEAALNPDNSNNFPIKSGGNWEKPTLDDMKWFLAEIISNKNGIPQDYTEPNPNINKLKEYYIADIDQMPENQQDAQYPLAFDKIEKHFDRPNKQDTPESKLETKENKERLDPNNVDKRDKPYVI